MIGAESGLGTRQPLAQPPASLLRVTAQDGIDSDATEGGERVGVTAAQDPLPVRQQLGEELQRPARVARQAGPECDVVAGSERVGVVAAQHPLLVRQQLGEELQRPGGSPDSAAQTAMLLRVVSVLGWSRPRTHSWSGSSSANSCSARARRPPGRASARCCCG